MKIVLDTNVLVSALLNPNGSPAQVLNLILNKKIQLIMDNRILLEYIDVLSRDKFKFQKEWLDPLLDFLKTESVFILPEPLKIAFADKDDKKFYEAAKTGKARFIVSGNLSHFPKEDFIVSPHDFLKQYFTMMN